MNGKKWNFILRETFRPELLVIFQLHLIKRPSVLVKRHKNEVGNETNKNLFIKHTVGFEIVHILISRVLQEDSVFIARY